MALRWMKLDANFWHSSEFCNVLSSKKFGKAAAFDVICLYSLALEQDGFLDLSQKKVRVWVEKELDLTSKKLDELIEFLCECGVFDCGKWECLSVLTCDRLLRDAEKASKTAEARKKAGEASAAARKQPTDDNI